MDSAEFQLVFPDEGHRQAVEDYKRKSMAENPHISGSARLGKYDFDTWLQYCKNLRDGVNLDDEYPPAMQYLAIRKSDGKMVGMIQIRHTLTPYFERFGGHIGYSVAPDERRKGIATTMMELALKDCRRHGLASVIISARKDNTASIGLVKKFGGEFIDTVDYEGTMLERHSIKT